jgi:predicted TIM-barrel fold metal-dependent hydrolase
MQINRHELFHGCLQGIIGAAILRVDVSSRHNQAESGRGKVASNDRLADSPKGSTSLNFNLFHVCAFPKLAMRSQTVAQAAIVDIGIASPNPPRTARFWKSCKMMFTRLHFRQRFAFPPTTGCQVLLVVTALFMLATGTSRLSGQETVNPGLPLGDFQPRSNLKNIHTTNLEHARFPVIDVHTHFGLRLRGDAEALDDYVDVMDRNRIAMCISLDEMLNSTCGEHFQMLESRHPGRFAVFVHFDFQGDGVVDRPETWDCNRPDFPRRVALMLEQASQQGVVGVKFFKQFGLEYRNADGSLIRIDDPRWDPVWEACARLNLPVLMHTGDPAAFFQPIDQFNERYEELSRHPEWSFRGADFPSRDELLAARNRVIERHPNTLFIGAHVAGNSEDLATVGQWLDMYPNLYVEPASRIAELGRQPFTAREFLIRYQDRILFGTDGPWPELRLSYYWRFLETDDEYFPYSEKQPPPQGLWQIYGVHLPDDVLRKIYSANALRLLPRLKERFEAVAR